MTEKPGLKTHLADPAAVFAAAMSLWQSCNKRAIQDQRPNLSESYNGMDQFMREVMRVANLFEGWACSHLIFEQMEDVWPYMLQDKFGDACLEILLPNELAQFNESDCLRVSLHLRLPIRMDSQLPIPIDIRAPNPVSGSAFQAYRIQTVRDSLEENEIVPFTADDDPFDTEFGTPYFGLYGVGDDGLVEHIADRTTYAGILSLLQKLVPGVAFPAEPMTG
ncbi:MAG: hypothetical protein JWQ04_548 [Pedosphaera sp.]|nr:hypothetical protein [Pedosphaera sp.]